MFLQRQSPWQFDLRSAIIGALVAWIIAGILYSQREALAELARNVWAPVAAWRRRVQASQEEKYIGALRGALKPCLLLAPALPELIFSPPSFRAFAPLPKTIAEVGQSAWVTAVAHSALLDGHPKIVVAGTQGSGRTTSLLMSLWQAIQQPEKQSQRPYKRLPVWIDLREMDEIPQESSLTPLQRLALLATRFLPDVLPKWLVRHLRNEPALLLLDNWEYLTEEQHTEVARWIAEADEALPDAVWIVASATAGYGSLVEVGFMPAELLPPADGALVQRLYEGWRTNLGLAEDQGELTEEAQEALTRAFQAGAPLWELHLRIALNLETGDLPARQDDVMSRFLASRLTQVDLGRNSEAWAQQAVDIAHDVLVTLAAAHRINGQDLTSKDIRETVEAALPPREERPRRLESAVRKILAESGLLRQEAKLWTLSHPLFADYLAACHLAAQEDGLEVLQAHLEDPTWYVLSEFYAGTTDAGALAEVLLLASEMNGDREALLRAARWAIVAQEDQAWRKQLNKALAQTFMEADLAWDLRLSIGHALSLVAGEGARAFFLRMLRQAAIDIRCAGIRGLGWAGGAKEMPLLAAALGDGSPAVQASAVDALHDSGTDGAVAFLAESLPQADEALMIHIAEALASLPAGWEALESATRHPDLLVRRVAALGLGLIEQPWAEERLLEMGREDAEWLVRSAAESAIQAQDERAKRQAQISAPPAIDEMDWLIAWAARQGQGLGVGEAARETLLRAAQEGNVDAKALSALTLAQIGRPADLPLLEVLAREHDPDVQRAATWALDQVRQRYRRYERA
ncbi:MAG: hypothetical protein JXC32_19930 [Anaerolineae bacterium]|nr:hypothetical protein [Anaerolineae bacterium]